MSETDYLFLEMALEEANKAMEDLAIKQRELMLEWAKNPNNIQNKVLLRKLR
ncbi:hypothetical protein [Bacillus cereus]|uniref:hypothetical protein n=1 Tax=Bacillus cereus TaxID=1396 RepID=UPI0035CB8AC9